MKVNLPKTDSIKELESFCDAHDMTEFDDHLEKVTARASERKVTVISVPLSAEQVNSLEELAQARGVDAVSLVQGWGQEKVQSSE